MIDRYYVNHRGFVKDPKNATGYDPVCMDEDVKELENAYKVLSEKYDLQIKKCENMYKLIEKGN